MWIDCHAHLFDLPVSSLSHQLEAAAMAGVDVVISTSTDLTNAAVVTSHTAFPQVYGAIGISPFDVQNLPQGWESSLESFLNHEKIIACGEIGIDATNPSYPPLVEQESVFIRQLEIANACNLPVIIHSRGAEEQALSICKNRGVSMAVFHCFTGSEDACAAIVDAGYCISLSGIITFSKCALREFVHKIPLTQLFIETDCPYLAPVPHRGKVNQPAWVSCTGLEVAKLLQLHPEVLAMQIRKNFNRIFLNAGTSDNASIPEGMSC